MSNAEQAPTPEELVEQIYGFAADHIAAGKSPSEVERLLVEQGLDAQSASTVVSNLVQARSQAYRSAGTRNMLIGALFCVGGILVTVISYNAAANNAGGGRYVVAWGAVIFGAIQFFRGLAQSGGGE